jgi:hypothetical protein
MEGDRKQETMRPVPVVTRMQEMFYPVRGKIVVGGVKLKDSAENKTNQTVLSIKLYDELDSVIHDVPIAASDSCNKVKGGSVTPEEGDNVLVSFINGDFFDPIVTAFLPVANNEIQADSANSPRSYRKFRGTHESIDKDGNRSVYVAAGDTLEVVGDGGVTIGGKLTITVTGDANIIATGKTTVQGEQVEIIGADGAPVVGVLTAATTCHFTGSPIVQKSETVKCSM